MSKNKGTLITSTIRPLSDSLNIPTAHANELLGGFQTVNSILDRDSIVYERREFGMLVYVVITDEFYQLKQISSSDLSDNLNWDLVPLGVGTTTEWVSSVISIEGTPPRSPTVGDRYLVNSGIGLWAGLDNFIVEWDGTIWSATLPTQGMSVNVDNETDGVYIYLNDSYPSGTWTKKLYVGDPFIIKNIIDVSETINVATGSEYLVHGDLQINGALNNWGRVVSINGNITGTVSNYGSGTHSSVYLLTDIISGTGISIAETSDTTREIYFNLISGTGISIGLSGSNYLISSISATPSYNKYIINSGETITIHDNEEYLIYGDLYVNGSLIIGTYGKVVIVNGSLDIGIGTVSNMGNVEIHDLLTDDNNNIKIDITELRYGKSGRILFESDLVYVPILATFARVITESDSLVYASSSSYLTSTASYNLEPYFGISVEDPLKKLHIHGSGILISGSESEQSSSLGDINSARFIIDSEGNRTTEYLRIRNDEGVVLFLSSIDNGGLYPSLSIGTDSSDFLLNVSGYYGQYLTIGRTGTVSVTTNIDVNQYSLDNALIDGIYMATHSSRHLPNGEDPLTTGTPSDIGTSNSVGTSNAFARQDHIHSHGTQSGGYLHATASYLDNGFMSYLDKQSLDSLIVSTISSVIISSTAISINESFGDYFGSFGTTSQVLTSLGNGVYWQTLATPSVLQITPADPISTTSSSAVMMGLGTSSSIFPNKSGTLLAMASGDVYNEDISGGSQIQLRYGISSAPANGDSATGSAIGGLVKTDIGSKVPFSLNAIIPNLTIGQNYWFDISLAAITGTSSISDISISIIEV